MALLMVQIKSGCFLACAVEAHLIMHLISVIQVRQVNYGILMQHQQGLANSASHGHNQSLVTLN